MKIITVDRVSKRYRLNQLGARSIREELERRIHRLFTLRMKGEKEEFYALREVSFEVDQGETLGLIGPNGSGKSTVLKLLSRIVYPTEGTIVVRGSVASLIEVGAGFHPELTGQENIFLYGSIMGMKRAEVREKFDRIIEFSGLERFIETPVKRYSSGMYVRLGFAVAAHINPKVLLVDEVLAVGDAAFQAKCQMRIEELRRNGMTIVFVSHDMSAVERLCNRVLFIDRGKIRAEGEPQSVIGEYFSTVVLRQEAEEHAGIFKGRNGCGAEIQSVRFLDRDGAVVDAIATGEPMVVQIEYTAYNSVEDPVFELFFYSADDHLHCHYSTALTGDQIPVLKGRGVVQIECEAFGLAPGMFKVDALLHRRGTKETYDWKPRQCLLKVIPGGKRVRGMFYSPHRWRLLPSNGKPELSNEEYL
jgi:ABC-type polysaccharide/polyol phosphate transport system ATPase subunit